MGVDDFKFRFDPSSSNPTKVLGPLESEIMQIIWRRGPSTVSQVHRELQPRKEIAYTTVMTTLSRLARKKLLDQDKSSSSYLYSARVDRSGFDSYVVATLMNALLSDNRGIFIDYLIANLGLLTQSERDRLKSALS